MRIGIILSPLLPRNSRSAFTLLEASIVLVVIALVAGAAFVGGDLVDAARLRAQLAQITRYQIAVADFKTLYGGSLPGDIKASQVAKLGFIPTPRAGTAGRGDGNGILEGQILAGGTPGAVISHLSSGENAFFWTDLTTNTRLISGNFNTTPDGDLGCCNAAVYLPRAQIGSGTFVYSYSKDGVNYLGLSAITYLDNNGAITLTGTALPGIQVRHAFNIDTKLDDGLPQSGTIIARYQNWSNAGGAPGNPGPGEPRWAAGNMTSTCGGVAFARSGSCDSSFGATTAATPASADTCYDNGNTAGNPQRYSMSQSGGTAKNCGLSFQLQ